MHLLAIRRLMRPAVWSDCVCLGYLGMANNDHRVSGEAAGLIGVA